MAYDERLAERVRAILSDEFGVTEQKMFGGLAFMLRGNMCCGVLGDELILRLGRDRVPGAIADEGLEQMDFTGRPMRAFAMAKPASLAAEEDLRRWVAEAVAFAGALPEK
ncbi:MAG: TfoX/Sxy family protein [Solirubrobacterales bacterium]